MTTPPAPFSIQARDAILHALTPRNGTEVSTILHALGAFMNACAECERTGAPMPPHGGALDRAEWRAATEMFTRGQEALAVAGGLRIVETSSPARAVALMQGQPDPGEPEPSKA